MKRFGRRMPQRSADECFWCLWVSLCAEHKGNKARVESDLEEINETVSAQKHTKPAMP